MKLRIGFFIVAVLEGGAAMAAPTQRLHSFAGGSDGAAARSTLIRDAAGNFYGTTNKGGPAGAGTVFKVTSGGVESVLYSFTGGSDGGAPSGGPLALDSFGNLYGTTATGGARGAGTVFMVTPNGVESVLYSFTDGADGGYPVGGLIADSSGNLYGECFDAGSAGGWGTVFKITTGGALTVLHSFAGYPSDGARPQATPALDGMGNVYGVTFQGGPNNAGTVFKVSTGVGTSTLYNFTSGSDGAAPSGGVVVDSAGDVFGTAGGGSGGYGTAFEIPAGGVFTVIYSAATADKAVTALSNPVLDAAGNIYGTTFAGGSHNDGSVYELSPHLATHHPVIWKLSLLHSFHGMPAGAEVVGSVVADSSGNLYGTTEAGGASNNGIIYKITH